MRIETHQHPYGLRQDRRVVLAWLWNRVTLGRGDWPRRLIYCLPMRTLVEQTRDSVREWPKKKKFPRSRERGPHAGERKIVNVSQLN
jgi:hypothetical protein